MSRQTRTFSDINLLFTKHPVTYDVTRKVDEEAVKASIRNLIQTKNYERPFHPEIGCQISSLLFENFTPMTREIMKKTILDVINKFEPRARLLDVRISENLDKNDLNVDIVFKLINSNRPVTFTTAISRVR